MHRATRTAVLSAAVIAAALGLGGCSKNIEPPPHSVVTLTPITSAPPADAAPAAPLPPPEALIDVMVRLTDPNLVGTDKIGLVQHSTPDDAAALDRFDNAVSDGGFRPLTFEAHDLTYAQTPAAVQANFVIKTANPEAGDFPFPLEFILAPEGTWQLTRESADMLLEFGGQGAAPTQPPLPVPTPTP